MGMLKMDSPAFFGFTPATKHSLPFAYSWHFSVWNWPVLPVMPWVMMRVFLLIRMDIRGSLLDRFDDLGGGFSHGIGRDDGQTGILQDLLAHIFVGALHADDQRHGQVNFLGSCNHAGGDGVALHDAAEDIDQNALDLGVLEHDLEGFGHLLGRGTATDVEEVGRLGAEQLDGVHGGHSQTGTVYQTANVAVEGDVGQVELGSFDFVGIVFVQIAHGDDFLLTEQGIGVKVELGVERLDGAIGFVNQRIDFGQRSVGFHVAGVQVLQRLNALRNGSFVHAHALGELEGLRIGQANQRIDKDLDDLFRGLVSNFFDIHATFVRGHHGDGLGSAVGQRSNVVFVLDVGTFVDQQVTNLLAFRTGLVRDQLHAQDLAGVFAHFFERGCDFDATTLATATGVNLGLDHPDLAAQGFGCLDRVVHGGAVNPARNGDAEFLQDLLALIFVNFHALSLRLVELRAMSGSRNSPDPTRLYRLGIQNLITEIKFLDTSKFIIMELIPPPASPCAAGAATRLQQRPGSARKPARIRPRPSAVTTDSRARHHPTTPPPRNRRSAPTSAQR